jgi:hypothetical protein
MVKFIYFFLINGGHQNGNFEKHGNANLNEKSLL